MLLEFAKGLDEWYGLGGIFDGLVDVTAGHDEDVELLEALVSFFEVEVGGNHAALSCGDTLGGGSSGARKRFGGGVAGLLEGGLEDGEGSDVVQGFDAGAVRGDRLVAA